MDERALSDFIDTTPALPEPQDFDLAAFIGGVRPTRRSVRIHARADLIGRLEQIADRIDALPDGAEVDALIDEAERMQAEFAAGVWFTIEKRSSEWVKHFRDDTAKTYGLDPESEDGRVSLLLHQLAAQIITPSGVTYDHLRAMFDTNEGELNKLIVALTMANEQIAEAAKVVTLDFSRRRSGQKAAPSKL